MARYVAKNIVAAELAQRCEVQLAYVIGVAQPVSVLVDTFGTGAIPEGKIAKLVQESFDLSPKGIIQTLDLKRPIYRATAAYGHFGRAPEEGLFTWERTDRAADLKRAAGRV
jgi:S-adenosylmethionine synthetase